MDLISIVIVTNNQLEYTRLCVASILRHTTEPYELIFVDNGSTDGTVEFLKAIGNSDPSIIGMASRRPERVTVAVNPENRGFPSAVNQGIRTAVGRFVLLLNNDTIVTEKWLTRMLQAFEQDSNIGMIGPCSNFVSGPQQIDVPYAGSHPISAAACDLHRLEDFARAWGEAHENQVQQVDRLVGFCLLMRKDMVVRIGMFDERFGIGNFEDDDYCRRALQAGFKLVIASDAFVHHFGGATFRSSGIDFNALIQRNQQLYRDKWADELKRTDEQCSIAPEIHPAQKSPLISLCMIARDNERTIAKAIESVRDLVDDLVVVDTGSTDTTPQIAADLGARVFHFPWCDDFSAARNESIRHAIGQWIFWIDTDDSIDAENRRKLQSFRNSLAHNPPPDNVLGFLMKVRCPGSGMNGGHGAVEVDHVKLFRNLPNLRFEFRIHEQILMAIRRSGGAVAWTDIVIDHSGSDQSPEGRARKLERDLRILGLEFKERPDHPFVLFNLGMTHENAGNFEQAIGFLWQSIGRSGDDDSHLRKAYAILVSCYKQLGRPVTAFEACARDSKAMPMMSNCAISKRCCTRH